MTEQLHFHFSLSCAGEGNGNPLQCSCLENPRDGGAWWAAIYGVAQSRTRLKRLSSSSSRRMRSDTGSAISEISGTNSVLPRVTRSKRASNGPGRGTARRVGSNHGDKQERTGGSGFG